MAGLVPGVTGFEGLGYPVSKWGTVAFTRYIKDHTSVANAYSNKLLIKQSLAFQ